MGHAPGVAQEATLETLMERYVDGDVAAFDTLYALIRPAVQASLRRWLRTDDQVADAFQVTLMKLHASRERYRRRAPVLPWVLTIARNVALDRLRSKASKELSLQPEAAEQIPDEQADLRWGHDDEAEVIRAVRDAVEQLPPSSREVVRLHKLEGKAMSEVAEALGIKEGAARVRAHRGYKALARLLFGLKSQRR